MTATLTLDAPQIEGRISEALEAVETRLLEVVSQDRFGGFAANELLEDIAAQRHPAPRTCAPGGRQLAT